MRHTHRDRDRQTDRERKRETQREFRSPLNRRELPVLCCSGCQPDTNLAEKFQEEAGQIYTTVFHKYNPRVRPPDFYPKPVPVQVHATLFHIRHLDILKQELECIMDLEIVRVVVPCSAWLSVFVMSVFCVCSLFLCLSVPV